MGEGVCKPDISARVNWECKLTYETIHTSVHVGLSICMGEYRRKMLSFLHKSLPALFKLRSACAYSYSSACIIVNNCKCTVNFSY